LNEVLGKLSKAEKRIEELGRESRDREVKLKEAANASISDIEADLAKSEQEADKLRLLEKQRDEQIEETTTQRDMAVNQVKELAAQVNHLEDLKE